MIERDVVNKVLTWAVVLFVGALVITLVDSATGFSKNYDPLSWPYGLHQVATMAFGGVTGILLRGTK